MIKNKIAFLFILLLFSLSNVLCAVQVSIPGSGMQIDYPKYDFIKLGNEHRFHIHVINETSAKTNKTTQCIVHLYNQTGYDINIGSTDMEFEAYNGLDFAKTLSPGNFSSIGLYTYVIQCNSSNEVAFASGQLNVNYAGYEITLSNIIYFFISVFILIILSIGLSLFSILFKNIALKIFLITIAVILFIISIGIMLSDLPIYLPYLYNLSDIYSSLYIVSIGLFSAGMAGIIIWLIYFAFTTIKKTRDLSYEED